MQTVSVAATVVVRVERRERGGAMLMCLLMSLAIPETLGEAVSFPAEATLSF